MAQAVEINRYMKGGEHPLTNEDGSDLGVDPTDLQFGDQQWHIAPHILQIPIAQSNLDQDANVQLLLPLFKLKFESMHLVFVIKCILFSLSIFF